MKCPVALDDNLGSPMPTDRPASLRSRLSSSVKSPAASPNACALPVIIKCNFASAWLTPSKKARRLQSYEHRT